MSDLDAITTCRRFPEEWSLKPWIRPDGRPDVSIPADWDTKYAGAALVDLAKTTLPDNGNGLAIDAAKAYTLVSEYLQGTTHPDHPPIKAK